MKRQALGTLLALAVIALVAWPATPMIAATRPPLAPSATARRAASGPTPRQLVGQKLVVAMHGLAPSADLLGRIQGGEVGGVILFGANITSAPQLVSLTRELQQAAVAGGRPPLLIATDQEGGGVKRLSWAPPSLSPPQMGASGSTTTAATQGKATGRVLACAGINNDLAPVADVPSSTASFMYQDGRTFSFDASVTASLSNAFASGLRVRGVMPAMKHFPGLGFAARNTDTHVVTIRASRSALGPGLRPYRTAVARNVPLIMLSNATYTAYDPERAAGWSQAISVGLLRQTLGFTGISITDSLTGIAAARGVSPTTLAIRAAQAGTDMILVSGTESATRATYAGLLAAARDGRIARSRLVTSYNRILATKAHIAAPPNDTTPPTVEAPQTDLLAGGQLGPIAAPVRSTWSASDPCHIARYVLQRQRNGGGAATGCTAACAAGSGCARAAPQVESKSKTDNARQLRCCVCVSGFAFWFASHGRELEAERVICFRVPSGTAAAAKLKPEKLAVVSLTQQTQRSEPPSPSKSNRSHHRELSYRRLRRFRRLWWL